MLNSMPHKNAAENLIFSAVLFLRCIINLLMSLSAVDKCREVYNSRNWAGRPITCLAILEIRHHQSCYQGAKGIKNHVVIRVCKAVLAFGFIGYRIMNKFQNFKKRTD